MTTISSETQPTPRERFIGIWFDLDSTITAKDRDTIWEWHENEIKEAEARGEARMKEKVQDIINDWDDYELTQYFRNLL